VRRHRGSRRTSAATMAGIGVVVTSVLVLGVAEPAFADNCSGLSDCSPSILGAIFLLAGVLGLGVAAAVTSSNPPGGGGGSGSGSGAGAGAGTGGAGTGGGSGPPGGPGPANPPAPPATTPPVYPIELPPTYEGDPAQQQAMNDARQRIADKLAHGQGPGSWVRDINPTGSDNNCVDAAKAVDQTLANNPSVAHPGYHGQNGEDLQNAYPGRPNQDTTLNDIANDMQQSGNGSRGIVTVYEGNDAHAINVYNDHGHLTWIDGQTGRVANTPGGILTPDGYDPAQATFKVLKTYP
jgi:hypothetical protein